MAYTDSKPPYGKDDTTGLTRLEYAAKYGRAAAGLTDLGGSTDGRTVVISPGGTQNVTAGRPGSPVVVARPIAPNIGNVTDAKNLFRGGLLDGNANAMSIANWMFNSGLIRQDPSTMAGKNAASKLYNRAVDDAADVNQAGNMQFSIMDALTLDYGSGTTSRGGGGGGKSTYKQYSSYTKAQARKKAIDAYRAVLGRSPNEKEISEFTNGLMKAAKAAPTVQTTTTKGGKTSQKTREGFNERDWTLGFLSGKIPEGEDLRGASGTAQDMVKLFSEEYGVKLSPSLAYDTIRDIVEGKSNADSVEQIFKQQAKIMFPHLSDKIDAGLNPKKIADAYISNTVNILEKAPTEVDMFNPYIKQALTYKDKDGNYALPTADEHARMLRGKSEWLDTRNGKETLMSAADNILRQMGFE
jgi:hypothetical protein